MRAAVLALVCGACGSSAYACTDHEQCVIEDRSGTCQPDGHCSFPDDGCPSGQRYGDHAGAAAGKCVPSSDDTTSTAPATSTSDTTAAPTTSSASTTASSSSSDTSTSTDDRGSESSDASTTGTPDPPTPLLWFSFDRIGADGIPNLGSLGGVASCSDGACPESIEGPVGLAAYFDGLDDCALFPATPEIVAIDALTITAWVRRGVIDPEYDCFLCKPVGADLWNSWRLATYDDPDLGAVGDFRVGLADNGGVSLPAPIPLDTWTFVAGTWNGETMAVWVDGVLVQEAANSAYEVDEQSVHLGCDDDHSKLGPTNFLTGSLDEVRLFGRELTNDEIQALYAEGL